MEVKIIEETKNKLIFDIVGESNTITGALKKELWKDKELRAASYQISHPLINIPRFVVESEKPRKSINSAIKRLQKDIENLKKEAKKIK